MKTKFEPFSIANNNSKIDVLTILSTFYELLPGTTILWLLIYEIWTAHL